MDSPGLCFGWVSVEWEVELLEFFMFFKKAAFGLIAIILLEQNKGPQLHFAAGKLRHKECDIMLDQLWAQKRSSPGPHFILSLALPGHTILNKPNC